MGALGLVVITTVGFAGVKQFVKHAIGENLLQKNTSRQVWLWSNTFCSLIHSVIAALWTIYCYNEDPRLLHDLLNVSTTASINLIAFSTGYFLYDLIDVLLHDKFRQWEIICHHFTVLFAFTIVLTTDKYLGFAVCALLMEFNSVFLHIRRLMKLANTIDNTFFRVNGILNLLTMVFVRICTCCWMIRWLLNNVDRIPSYYHYLYGLAGMTVMTCTNIGLMYRLWQSDFKTKQFDTKIFKEIKK